MSKSVSTIARVLSSICAILFILTMILALLLTNLHQLVFNADLTKRVLIEQDTYKRLPGILGEALISNTTINLCGRNPLACSMDWVSPKLHTCLTNVLGRDAYFAIGTGLGEPTAVQLQSARDECLIPFESSSLGTDTTSSQEKLPSFLQKLNSSDWEAIIKAVLPPVNLQVLAENMIDQFFSYLKGETDEVTLPLVEIKQQFSEQTGLEAIRLLLSVQPPCTQDRLDQMAEGGEIIICNPSGVQFIEIIPTIQEQLVVVVKQVPDEIAIIKPIPAITTLANRVPVGNNPLSLIPILVALLPFSPFIPLIFLLLVTLLAVRSLKSWLRWWGVSIFFTGIMALGIGFVTMPAVNWAWNTFVVIHFPPTLPTGIIDVAHEVVRVNFQGLPKQIFLQAGVLTLIGMAAWVSSFFATRGIKETIPAQPHTSNK